MTQNPVRTVEKKKAVCLLGLHDCKSGGRTEVRLQFGSISFLKSD